MLDETTIATLKREKAALEEIMKNGRARVKALDTVLKAYDQGKPSTNGRTPRGQPARSSRSTPSDKPRALRDDICEVLSIRQPLSAQEIRASLTARGVEFTDTNVSYTLSQSHLFENANGKWSLTEFDDE